MACALIAGGAAIGPSTAVAAPPAPVDVYVNTTLDTVGTVGSDSTPNCDSPCSLRKAIQYANGDPGASTVIHLPAGDYVLTRPQGDADLADGGDLHVLGKTQIIGEGAANTIIEQSPNVADRVLLVRAATRITGVTIRNGKANHDDGLGGGGIVVYGFGSLDMSLSVISHNQAPAFGQGSFDGYGGAVMASPFGGRTVVLHDVTISENTAAIAGGGIAVVGGSLTVYNSTIAANTCTGKGTCQGGGAYASSPLNLTNDTLDGNLADEGGGLYSLGAGAVVTNVTFSSNSLNGRAPLARPVATTSHTALPSKGAAVFGYGFNGAGAMTLQNTLINGDPADECGQGSDGAVVPLPVTSLGSNIDDGISCPLTETGDQRLTSAELGPLLDNGGSTKTRALPASSKAVDAVKGFCPPPAADQRKVARANAAARTGTACDIGAYEYAAPAPAVTPAPTPTTVVQDVIIFVPYTPTLPRAGIAPAAARFPALGLLSLVGLALTLAPAAWLTYHMALPDMRGVKSGRQ